MTLCNELGDEILKSRLHERKSDVRGDYYRDTTAILHSSPFRRLKHKTQVFYAPSNDHICTRIEHCLHVASIASTICRGLNLDTELATAIGMGHDIGHTPFGHTGERIISKMMEKEGLGPFQHEVNSLRVVDFLAGKGSGLNLTYAVRDGIVCHCGESLKRSLRPTGEKKDLSAIRSREALVPSTWEAAVVRFSDSIAYLGRDWEDATRLGIVTADDLPSLVKDRLGRSNAEIINTLVRDLIDHTTDERGVSFSERVFSAVEALSEFNYRSIYRSPLLDGYERYFTRLIKLIHEYLEELRENCGDNERLYRDEKNMLAMGFYRHREEMKKPYRDHDGDERRMVFDYIAGMSDNFCLDCADEILKPLHLGEKTDNELTGRWFDAR